MAQLHEILACESEIEKKKTKIHDETIVTFSKKGDNFNGWNKRVKMFDEERANEESEENHEPATSVIQKLNYMKESHIDFWDLKLRKEAANQKAKGNVSTGDFLVNDLPVSFLLTIEKELKLLREVFDEIPTLAPGMVWEEDEMKGIGIYKTKDPIVRKKTQKKVLPLLLSEATKEHKAQVTTITEERPVGDIIENRWSGMLTPAEKSKYLGRIDTLLLECKKARQRANTIEIGKESIGEKIFRYILA